MKLIKKSVIVLLSILTAAQAFTFCAAAIESDTNNSSIVGDVDGDGVVNIVDATLIQKYVAQLIGSDRINLTAADINLDESLTVDDATKVQIYAAGLPNSSYAGMSVSDAVNSMDSNTAIRTPIR